MKKIQSYVFFALSLFYSNAIIYGINEIWNTKQYERIKKEKSPIVVKFSANWCEACNVTKPIFEKVRMNPNFSHITFFTIDVDNANEVAERENIKSIPTFLLIENGKIKARIVGVENPKTFENLLTKKIRSSISLQDCDPECDTFWKKTNRFINELWQISFSIIKKIQYFFGF